jgi:hypothetical protein
MVYSISSANFPEEVGMCHLRKGTEDPLKMLPGGVGLPLEMLPGGVG